MPQLFLHQITAATLEGCPVQEVGAHPRKVKVPLPLHARNLLTKLPVGMALNEFVEQLRPLLRKAPEVSRARRLTAVAICGMFPLIVVALLVFSSIPMKRSIRQHPELGRLAESIDQLSILRRVPDLTGGLDGGGAAYSANLLGSSRSWNGTPFTLGPPNATNTIRATGQTIALPPGRFSSLKLLGCAVYGAQTGQTFTVTYAGSARSNITQSFSDWFHPQHYAGESNALQMAYRNLSTGTNDPRTFYLFGYSFDLDPAAMPKSITLPNNTNVQILAMTLGPPATPVDLSTAFNHRDGFVADGSVFADQKHHREALEIYIAGHFRSTITNPVAWNSLAGLLIPPDHRRIAEQLVSEHPAPTSSELERAASEVAAFNAKQIKVRLFDSSEPQFIFFTAVLALAVYIGIPSLFAALVFRGGPVFALLGMVVVNRSGTRASRVRVFWRGIIAWVPFFLLTILFLACIGPNAPRGLQITAIALFFAVISLTVVSVLLPHRSLPDRMAGTWLVLK